MLPAYELERIREDYMVHLTEKVSISRLRDGTNYLGVPNSDSYELVRGMESVACRFVRNDSSILNEDGTDLNLDTVRVIFPHNIKRLEVDDLIIRDERRYRVIGVLDKETDLIGITAIAKHIREELAL